MTAKAKSPPMPWRKYKQKYYFFMYKNIIIKISENSKHFFSLKIKNFLADMSAKNISFFRSSICANENCTLSKYSFYLITYNRSKMLLNIKNIIFSKGWSYIYVNLCRISYLSKSFSKKLNLIYHSEPKTTQLGTIARSEETNKYLMHVFHS